MAKVRSWSILLKTFSSFISLLQKHFNIFSYLLATPKWMLHWDENEKKLTESNFKAMSFQDCWPGTKRSIVKWAPAWIMNYQRWQKFLISVIETNKKATNKLIFNCWWKAILLSWKINVVSNNPAANKNNTPPFYNEYEKGVYSEIA